MRGWHFKEAPLPSRQRTPACTSRRKCGKNLNF